MKSNVLYMPNTTQIGLNLVKQGNYAFLVESTTNEYFRQRDCTLMQVGDLLDAKSYGLGLQKNSIWRERISNGIIYLQESGQIPQYYEKWWKQIDATNCESSTKRDGEETEAMNFSSVSGIFLVLGIGLIIACLIAFVEYNWKVKRKPKNKVNLICFYAGPKILIRIIKNLFSLESQMNAKDH